MLNIYKRYIYTNFRRKVQKHYKPYKYTNLTFYIYNMSFKKSFDQYHRIIHNYKLIWSCTTIVKHRVNKSMDGGLLFFRWALWQSLWLFEICSNTTQFKTYGFRYLAYNNALASDRRQSDQSNHVCP
jgi:hypothetical protein